VANLPFSVVRGHVVRISNGCSTAACHQPVRVSRAFRCHDGSAWRPAPEGYATLEEHTDMCNLRFAPLSSRVHGVLYRLPRSELNKLAKREGGYRLQDIEVRDFNS